MRWHKPVAYQTVNGSRKLIECAYARKGQRLGFATGEYDRAKPLVIDPELEYSTYMGGSILDEGGAIAADVHGNAYVTGSTLSPDFPTKNAFQPNYLGNVNQTSNAFVAKFNSAGELVYSTYLGGGGDAQSGNGDQGNGIAVDGAGNAYVTGVTASADFPLKNAFQTSTCSSNIFCSDAFVTKLDAAGSALVYSTFLGGINGAAGQGIAVDAHGNAYVAGSTQSTDFPVKDAFQGELKGTQNAFITKFDVAGTVLVYSTYLGGGGDAASGVAVDAHGSAYATGTTTSSDFPIKNAFQEKPKNIYANAFVTKFDAAGTALIYSTYLSGSGRRCGPQCGGTGDSANAIAVDAYEHAYVIGNATSLDFPVKNAFQPKLEGRCYECGNAFVTKFDAVGSELAYSTYLGGGGDTGNGVAVDREGNAYIAGVTRSAHFPTKNAFQKELKPGASFNAFVAKIGAYDCALVYSSYLGGSGSDAAAGIAVDAAGNAYVAGTTNSKDFPTKNAFQPELKATYGSAFVAKISAK